MITAGDLLGHGSQLPLWPYAVCGALLLASVAALRGIRRWDAAVLRAAEMGASDG